MGKLQEGEDTVLEIGFPIGFHVVWIKERQTCFVGFRSMFSAQGLGAQRIFIKLLKKPCKKTKNR